MPSFVSIGSVGQVPIIRGTDSFEPFIDTDTETATETDRFLFTVITDNISIV